MILVLLTVMGATAVGWARGGRLANLSRVRLRAAPLVVCALVAQVAVVAAAAADWPAGVLAVGQVLLGLSQAAVLAFLWANRWLPGMPLIALGALANSAVVTANGAMPVARDALVAVAGGPVSPPTGVHVLAEAVTGGARLPWLGDVIALPLLRSVVSVGDVLLAAGVALLMADLMLARPRVLGRRSAALLR